MSSRHLLALALLSSPAGFLAASGTPSVVGFVVRANLAHLGNYDASVGTTVYEGDQVSTESGGALRLKCNAAIIELGERSSATVRGVGTSAATELGSGGVVVSSARAVNIEIAAKGAEIRGINETPGIAEVTIRGPKELMVYARRGRLELVYGGEEEMIEEGEAYRVILDPTQDTAQRTKPPAKHPHLKFILIATGIAAAVVVPVVVRALESPVSPDRP